MGSLKTFEEAPEELNSAGLTADGARPMATTAGYYPSPGARYNLETSLDSLAGRAAWGDARAL